MSKISERINNSCTFTSLRWPGAGLALLVLLVLFSSCSARVGIELDRQGGASVVVSETTHPLFQAYLEDFASLSSDSQQVAVSVDTQAIREQLAESVRVLSMSSTPGSFETELQLGRLEDLFQGRDDSLNEILTVSRSGNRSVFTMELDRDAVRSLLGLGREDSDVDMEYLLPADDDMSKDEYQDDLDWAMEEYGTDSERRAMFGSSTIDLTIQLPGRITNSRGFRIINRDEGVLAATIDVLSLLTLQAPLVFRAEYQ